MRRVLLLSADDALASAYRARLRRLGDELDQGRNWPQGMAKARQAKPDLIVLDPLLPGMHGLDVLKWLRDVPWLVQVPVVLLAEGTVPEEVVRACRFWGAVACLAKDRCSLDELVEELRTRCPATTA